MNKANKAFVVGVLLFGVFLAVSCWFPGTVKAPVKNLEEPLAAPPPPPMYQSPHLNPLDQPRAYLKDSCRYLKNKWNSTNAEPGTVVMVVLIKNINRGTAEIPGSVSLGEFRKLMEQLHMQGFEAINTKQLQAFMERNVKIPPRSVYLIQAGNQNHEYYENVFGDYYEDWGWTVVNGWVSNPRVSAAMLEENVALEYNGFVDHQAYGVFPETVLTDDSSKVVIARELQGSVNGMAEHFAKRPVAILWPHGSFGVRPVEVARQLRFKLGFTSNLRGPLLYNWVPLADEFDPQRPTLIPEGGINDPLMTLPVYSPQEALEALDVVRIIGNEASAYAQENKAAEIQYYKRVCEASHGEIP